MGERRINWGDSETDARYITEDTGTGANFTVVEDLNGNTVVLQYDQTNLVGGVPLDLSGQDLLGTDIVDGANINLSDIAGENITADGVNNELDTSTTSNVPDWAEDTNSPITGTGAQSQTITFNSNFDVWLVHFQAQNTSGSSQRIGVQVNGDSGTNYSGLNIGGGTNSNKAEAQFSATDIPNNDSVRGWIGFDGRFGDDWRMWFANGVEIGSTPSIMWENTNVSSPVNSATITGAGGNIDVAAEFYGRDRPSP